MLEVIACTVALLACVVEQETIAADAHTAVDIVAVAERALHVAPEFDRRIGRYVVDHPADGLRPEQQGARALEDFHAAIAVDRRVVVARVVAVGGIGQRDAVLE